MATEHNTLEGEINFKEGDISFCIECGESSELSHLSLEKVEVYSLDKETIKEIKIIRDAWLRTKNLIKLEGGANDLGRK